MIWIIIDDDKKSMGKYRYNRYHDLEIDVGCIDTGSKQKLLDCVRRETRMWERKINGRRGCEGSLLWMRIPLPSRAHTLPWFLEVNFRVHHGTAEYIMVVRGRSPSAVPPMYGTHYVRVECLVVERGTNKVLLVSEKIGSECKLLKKDRVDKSTTTTTTTIQQQLPDSTLKLVTGSVNPGEFVAAAAAREVLEETGVVATVLAILGCGNRLATRFNKDEILIGLAMVADPGQIPKFDAKELMYAGWHDMADVAESCTRMTKEWLAVAAATAGKLRTSYGYITDLRGPPHRLEFHSFYRDII